MTGFIELRFENGRRVSYSDGLFRVWRDRRLTVESKEESMSKQLLQDYMRLNWTECLSEDAEENECDCWKKGLE
jgi:hypothetical protein